MPREKRGSQGRGFQDRPKGTSRKRPAHRPAESAPDREQWGQSSRGKNECIRVAYWVLQSHAIQIHIVTLIPNVMVLGGWAFGKWWVYEVAAFITRCILRRRWRGPELCLLERLDKKVTVCKPNRESSLAPDQAGTVTSNSQSPESCLLAWLSYLLDFVTAALTNKN